jgi:DNA-binding MarR family transcriptional regulator
MVSMEINRTTEAVRPAGAKPASTLESHLGYWLRLVSNEVSGAFARSLGERQVSVAEWVALNQIAVAEELTPARLAASIGMTRGAVSKILDKLEAKKLIARTTSHHDSRVQLLALTGQGRRILPELTAVADNNDERFFGALDPVEQVALRGLLQKVAAVHEMRHAPLE